MITATARMFMPMYFRGMRGRRWRKRHGAWSHEDGDTFSGEFQAR